MVQRQRQQVAPSLPAQRGHTALSAACVPAACCSSGDSGCGDGTEASRKSITLPGAACHYFIAVHPFEPDSRFSFRLTLALGPPTSVSSPPPPVLPSPPPAPPALGGSPPPSLGGSPPPPSPLPPSPSPGTFGNALNVTNKLLPWSSPPIQVRPWHAGLSTVCAPCITDALARRI